MEVLVNRSALHQSLYHVLVEAIGQDAVFVHQVSHENQSAWFGHALCLVQGLQLLLIADEVIERTEQQRNVSSPRRQKRHIARVALHNVCRRLTLQENIYIAPHQLHRLHPIAFSHKSRGVASRSCTNVEQERVWLDEAAQVMHGGFKLYDAVPALQAKVFGVLVVMLLYIG